MKARIRGLLTLAVTGFALIGCLPTQGEKPRPCHPGKSDRCSTTKGPTVVLPGEIDPRILRTRTGGSAGVGNNY